MKITNTALYVGLLLAGSYTSSAVANEHTKVRHHHLPPHMTNVDQGVVETKDAQASQLIKTVQPQLQTMFAQPSELVSSAASCSATASSLASASTSSKINQLKNTSDFSCLSDELWGSSTSLYQGLFNESVMIAIANEARSLALSYDGTNSNRLRNFILYLRVGYWAQWGNSATIGDYTQTLTDANHAFLDTFAANPSYYSTNEQHANNASEAMILMSNFSADRYWPQAEQVIQRYSINNGSNMQRLMTQALTLLYRGNWNSDYRAAVEANPSILNTLDSFLRNNTNLLGHRNEYQFNDAASELGRFLQYGGQTYERAKPLVKDVLDRYSITGTGSGAWLNLANQVEYADSANCDYYGTCGYLATLEQQVLPITHSCSDTLTVRAQEMTQSQLEQICSDLAVQEAYFHEKLETNNIPVADDYNTALEMVIYNSSDDYQTYSGILFNHGTNNGGIYLEGDPSQEGNIARFLAYEAEWMRPTFQVWNLEHEYVHYLDGRFDLYGDFQTGNAHDTVWWSEGLAEYISKRENNDDAVAQAPNKTYALSTLFRTNYSNSANQIYDWGYLAVRYMFEEQKADVDNILTEFRIGDYDAYDTLLDNYGTNFDQSFSNWLDNVTSYIGEDPVDPVDPGTSEVPDVCSTEGPISYSGVESGNAICVQENYANFYILVPAGSEQLTIRTNHGEGDLDLYHRTTSWPTVTDYDYASFNSGTNEETITINSPESAWHLITLRNHGAGVSLLVDLK